MLNFSGTAEQFDWFEQERCVFDVVSQCLLGESLHVRLSPTNQTTNEILLCRKFTKSRRQWHQQQPIVSIIDRLSFGPVLDLVGSTVHFIDIDHITEQQF
jgi:hypothetical protein